MLGLYLYTLIIGDTFCSMFGIRTELTLQKQLQISMLIMYMWTKSKITTTTKQKEIIKSLPEPEIEPWISCTAV